jgi:hypothetical protein
VPPACFNGPHLRSQLDASVNHHHETDCPALRLTVPPAYLEDPTVRSVMPWRVPITTVSVWAGIAVIDVDTVPRTPGRMTGYLSCVDVWVCKWMRAWVDGSVRTCVRMCVRA